MSPDTYGRLAFRASHDLRHTYATLALQAGVHQGRPGARALVDQGVFDTYSYAVPVQEEVAARIAAILDR